MFSLRNRTSLLAGIALLAPLPAAAQTAPATTDPAVVPPPAATDVGTKRIYSPADFVRFAPRTAYDMLVQVPGFTIRGGDEEASERGLGQASENVLIDGQRIANKSGGALVELQKLSVANVERIEIVDAASLGIAGLSGLVANVIRKAVQQSSGQFQWQPDFRAHYSKPNFFRGNVSYSGETGPVDYTLSLRNQAGRGAYGGPIVITDALGALVETREETVHSEFDQLNISTKLALDGPGSSLGNLTLAVTPFWNPATIEDERTPVDGDDSARLITQGMNGWGYDINADYEFALGPGRLKLIGVRQWDKEPVVVTQVMAFENGDPDSGIRFSRDSRIAETIGRAEYGWKTGRNDWQLSFERAFNSLDQRGTLEELNEDGEFKQIDFPGGTGKVQELRYEAMATLSRPLGPTIDLQVAAGGEFSRLERVDGDDPARKFWRPKGSVSLGWRPAPGWDASLKLRRRVGQISFYDFLAQVSLSNENENDANPDLVPPQSWEAEAEVGRELGAWGKTRLRSYFQRIDDIVDFIPIGDDGEGVGNLPRASRFGLESTSTFQFEPIGLAGAKLDLTLGFERTRVRDPLTGEQRPISGTRDRWVSAEFRHDIPGTDYAWGASASHNHFGKSFRVTEVYRNWEGPWWVGVFVEHKDVMGLTVRASAGNLLNARHRQRHVVYTGFRDTAPIASIRSHDQLIGPIFSFMVKGTF